MAISANLGRDTHHNSTKLVCDHPLADSLRLGFSLENTEETMQKQHFKKKG